MDDSCHRVRCDDGRINCGFPAVKDGGRKDKSAPPTEKAASPENQKEARQTEENGPQSAPQGADDYLDDVAFISEMQRVVTPDGHWQQYDAVLDARGYGWDMMKNWADYMAVADLEHISQVETGDMDGEKLNVTESYAQHGESCRETPELSTERGMLSIAGMSKVLLAPVKIAWINQTNRLRFFTVVVDETTLRKYVETMVRRNFGSEDAMKLGKSAAACGKAAEKPASAKKLNLGTYSSSNADRQRLAVLPKKGLPERADTAQAHSSAGCAGLRYGHKRYKAGNDRLLELPGGDAGEGKAQAYSDECRSGNAARFRSRKSTRTAGCMRPTEKPSAITIPSAAHIAARLILIMEGSRKIRDSACPAASIWEGNYIMTILPGNKST